MRQRIIGLVVCLLSLKCFFSWLRHASEEKQPFLSDLTLKDKATAVLAAKYEGRIGNNMFQYAALYSLAKRHDVIPVIPTNFPLAFMFELTAPAILPKEPFELVFTESNEYSSEFWPSFNDVHITGIRAGIIEGFFQSWKYFQNHDDDIRKEFKFRKHILAEAHEFVERAMFKLRQNTSTKITTIGVHVRRGDFLSEYFSKIGFVSAPIGYFSNAMDRMTSFYGQDVLFVVTSDDIKWCEENLPRDKGRAVTFSKSDDRAVDMAILTSCDHVIISTGSFGWWAAWLANGTTIYYEDFPSKNSPLADRFIHADYYPPSWIGLSEYEGTL